MQKLPLAHSTNEPARKRPLARRAGQGRSTAPWQSRPVAAPGPGLEHPPKAGTSSARDEHMLGTISSRQRSQRLAAASRDGNAPTPNPDQDRLREIIVAFARIERGTAAHGSSDGRDDLHGGARPARRHHQRAPFPIYVLIASGHFVSSGSRPPGGIAPSTPRSRGETNPPEHVFVSRNMSDCASRPGGPATPRSARCDGARSRQRATALYQQRHRTAVARPVSGRLAEAIRDPHERHPRGVLDHGLLLRRRRRLAAQHRHAHESERMRDRIDRVELTVVDQQGDLALLEDRPRPTLGRALECGGTAHQSKGPSIHRQDVSGCSTTRSETPRRGSALRDDRSHTRYHSGTPAVAARRFDVHRLSRPTRGGDK